LARQPLTTRDKVILLLLAVATIAVVGYRYLTRPQWDLYDPAALAGTPTVVSFSTGSCPACVEQRKVFQALRPQVSGRVRLWSVNVGERRPENTQAIQQFGIRFVPTLVFFDAEGRPVDIQTGYLTADQLREAFRVLGWTD